MIASGCYPATLPFAMSILRRIGPRCLITQVSGVAGPFRLNELRFRTSFLVWNAVDLAAHHTNPSVRRKYSIS